MPSAHRCSVCGGERFEDRKILWPELIAAWSLSPEQAAYIDRQQGRTCLNCGTAWRSMALAAAIMQEFDFPGLFQDFVTDHRWKSLAVLEINAAGQLSRFLEQLPGHQRADYPDVDMQCMPIGDDQFDLIVHSDTLEHIPDPLKALRECCRVLKPAGKCLYTVPIIPDRLSRSRDGLPPSYHGNNSNPEDYRVFTEFGADCWTYPLSAGFQSCRIHAWEFPSALAMCAQAGRLKSSPNVSAGDATVACRPVGKPFRPPSIDELRKELSDIHSSTSWRITAPLRWIRNLANRIRHRLLKRSS